MRKGKTMSHRWVAYLSLIALSLWGGLVDGALGKTKVLADFTTGREPVPKCWELSVNSGEAQLQLVQDDGQQALYMRSDQASFALQKKERIPLQETPWLVWQWKVTAIPRGGDFRRSATDDQAAQLIVAFSSSHFLTYIWDSTVPKGTLASAPAPLFKKLFALVVQSGTSGMGIWFTERRNLIEDYKKAYNEEAEALEGIRIQINSQHTSSQAESYWRAVSITAKP
jgi:hypothetical protein